MGSDKEPPFYSFARRFPACLRRCPGQQRGLRWASPMDPKPLIEQSLWWLLPGALFSLFMVHAMVMFTAALLTKRPRARNQPLTADELRARLLELNDDRRLMAKLAPGRDCDFTLDCNPAATSWSELYSPVKFTPPYRARLLLDEATREASWNELMRGSNFFLGFDGL